MFVIDMQQYLPQIEYKNLTDAYFIANSCWKIFVKLNIQIGLLDAKPL